jgi:chemotaxis signal transduction protein
MENEKKIWLIEQYAQKAWTLSLVLSQEAARAGSHGKGYAIVAHEARLLADKLHEYAAKVHFDKDGEHMFKGLVDFATMFKFLSVNAALEIMHMADVNMEFNIPKSMSVFAEELRRIAITFNELANPELRAKPLTIPEIAAPSETAGWNSYFIYSIAAQPLIENPMRILEITLAPRHAIAGKEIFTLRGVEIPVIDCCKILNLPQPETEWQTVLIINNDGKLSGCNDNVYAIAIDDLDVNAIFYSRPGRPVEAKKTHAFNQYARECWDVAGDEQVVFADWRKLRG